MSNQQRPQGSRRSTRARKLSGLAVALLGLLLSGVAGGHAFAPPDETVPLARGDARSQVTFTGFHVFEDGSSRIWVRLTQAVNVDEKRSKGKVTYVLRGARVPGRNNKNPLITTYFDSAVMNARLIPTKHDAELVVTLKQEVDPKHRVVTRPDGTSSVQIDFPPPPVKTPPPPDPVPPPPKEPPAEKPEGEPKE